MWAFQKSTPYSVQVFLVSDLQVRAVLVRTMGLHCRAESAVIGEDYGQERAVSIVSPQAAPFFTDFLFSLGWRLSIGSLSSCPSSTDPGNTQSPPLAALLFGKAAPPEQTHRAGWMIWVVRTALLHGVLLGTKEQLLEGRVGRESAAMWVWGLCIRTIPWPVCPAIVKY